MSWSVARTIVAAFLLTLAIVVPSTPVLALPAAQVPAPVLSVVDQPIVNDTVTAAEVTAPNDGWIAVHAFQADGKLIVNQVVGTARVPAGTSTNVAVTLNESFKPGDTLVMMLHINEEPADSFDFPGGDEAVLLNGQIVLKQFKVLDAAAPVTTMPETGQLPLPFVAIGLVAVIVLLNGFAIRRRAMSPR